MTYKPNGLLKAHVKAQTMLKIMQLTMTNLEKSQR
jgi:hypothetical protein